MQQTMLIIALGLGNGAAPCWAGEEAGVRSTIAKAVPYLKASGVKWMKKRDCVSCHQITSMLWSLNAAAKVGIKVDDGKLTEWSDWSREKMADLENDPKKKPPVDNMIQLLLGRGGSDHAKYPESEFAEFPRWIMAQRTNGFWKAGGQLPRQKRPGRETDEVTTMWTILALTPYARDESHAIDFQAARSWLTKGKPGISTEWWAVRALTELNGKLRTKHKEKLLSLQNEDGGWGFIAGQNSDALATGMALYALSKLQVPSESRSIRRARSHLAGSQRINGSWEVPSTKKANKEESNPISNYWGTGWAVIGLAASLERGD